MTSRPRPPRPARPDPTSHPSPPNASAVAPPARPSPDGRAGRGRCAEALVTQVLEARGWTVLGRNLRAGRGELDLCALHRGVLHVVEVRSRVGRHGGDPLESVGPRKRRTLARTVAAALGRGLLPRGHEIRFDVATVVWPDARSAPEVTICEGAFDAVDLM